MGDGLRTANQGPITRRSSEGGANSAHRSFLPTSDQLQRNWGKLDLFGLVAASKCGQCFNRRVRFLRICHKLFVMIFLRVLAKN